MQADWYTNNLEDFRFPLPVQDANLEIATRLDDEALYELCFVNKSFVATCTSPSIWNTRSSSPLAPLFFLKDNYKNWMDFYANVKQDWLYVVVQLTDTNKLLGVNAFIDAGKAFEYLIEDAIFATYRLTLETYLDKWSEQLGYQVTLDMLSKVVDIMEYVDDRRSTTIFMAHKRRTYSSDNYGDYILYSINPANKLINTDILNYPLLQQGSFMVVYYPITQLKEELDEVDEVDAKERFKERPSEVASEETLTFYYDDVNTLTLRKLHMLKYKAKMLIPITFTFRRWEYGFYLGNFEESVVILIDDRVIDGSNDYRIVLIPTSKHYKGELLYKRLLYPRINFDDTQSLIDFFKNEGTFYDLKDLHKVVDRKIVISIQRDL